MALTQKKLSKAKQLRLAGMLIAVIGITVSVAYYGLLRKPKPTDIANLPFSAESAKNSIIPPPKNSAFKLMEELSKDPLFKTLKSFGTWPLSIQPKGRSQPFIQNLETKE
ncbi:MAG: hypothetical protein CO042_01165 [Parcubacteria group bacterium CG_4_9_14_0_2_um_filter_41_8]|nr:MAG: hypothetical protein CO042_01165 [Parcubacteria group bacterium CG_4_9_14_0_2_um_filter_41_8]